MRKAPSRGADVEDRVRRPSAEAAGIYTFWWSWTRVVAECAGTSVVVVDRGLETGKRPFDRRADWLAGTDV